MNLFGVMEVSGSALLAERQRAEVVTSNLANAETTRTADGGPYKRQHVVFGAAQPRGFAAQLASFSDRHVSGVKVESIVADNAPPVQHYDPSHPDADAQGFVSMPAINPVEEMADLMGAARSYQLNAAAVQATRGMIQQSVEILR